MIPPDAILPTIDVLTGHGCHGVAQNIPSLGLERRAMHDGEYRVDLGPVRIEIVGNRVAHDPGNRYRRRWEAAASAHGRI
jgi:hypothetical protein